MGFARLERLISLGQSADRDGRHVRVTNALALLGFVLSMASAPLDAFEAPLFVFVMDIVSCAGFAACWILNAHGYCLAAQVVLLIVTNAEIATGVIVLGGLPELRALFFPLALLPFLVLDVARRRWLAVFTALAVAEYFVTGLLHHRAPGLSVAIYIHYAPALTFTMIIAGSFVFAQTARTADDKLLEARTRAAQGARLIALGEISGSIAHEIRNPLAAIQLAAAQIESRPDDTAQVTQLGQRIQRVVTRASRIIDSLRSFARDASGDPVITIPVERIIADSLELCGRRFIDKNIALSVGTVPADLTLDCRSVQLTQVLVNLLGNAADAVADVPDRWVRVDVEQDDTHVSIAVSDSGEGVPAAARGRIFEPFFTTKSSDRGTGIGLSLSRGMVEAHHGTLTLDPASPPTRFVMRVPRVQPGVRSGTQ